MAAEAEVGFFLQALTAVVAAVGVTEGGALALGACFGVAAVVWAYVRVAPLEAALVAAGAMLRAAEATCCACSALALALRIVLVGGGNTPKACLSAQRTFYLLRQRRPIAFLISTHNTFRNLVC